MSGRTWLRFSPILQQTLSTVQRKEHAGLQNPVKVRGMNNILIGCREEEQLWTSKLFIVDIDPHESSAIISYLLEIIAFIWKNTEPRTPTLSQIRSFRIQATYRICFEMQRIFILFNLQDYRIANSQILRKLISNNLISSLHGLLSRCPESERDLSRVRSPCLRHPTPKHLIKFNLCSKMQWLCFSTWAAVHVSSASHWTPPPFLSLPRPTLPTCCQMPQGNV